MSSAGPRGHARHHCPPWCLFVQTSSSSSGAQRVNVYSGLGLQSSCLEPRVSKRTCHSWRANALPGTHHLPLTPTGRMGYLGSLPICNATTFTRPAPVPVTQNDPSAAIACTPPNYYYRLYKGLSVDQRMAMTSIGG